MKNKNKQTNKREFREEMLEMGYTEEDINHFQKWLKKPQTLIVKPGRTKPDIKH